jgi:rubrerythrin
MFTSRDILDLAVQIEKNGEKVYRGALQVVANPEIRSLLQRLADDETRHVDRFLEFKENTGDTPGDPKLEEMGRSILLGILGDQSFSLKEADFSRMERIKDLFKVAVEFEKDTVIFYEMIRAMIEDDETAADLNKIIEEEKRHIELFEEFLGPAET